MKSIYKFNNGSGATLCNKCRKIISISLTDDLFCSKDCEAKYRADNFAVGFAEWVLNIYIEHKQNYIIEELLEIYKTEKQL